MPIAILKSNTLILLILTLLLSGCADPAKQKAQSQERAAALAESGDYAGAGKILNQIAADYPEDLAVRLAIADLYQAQGDPARAARALQQAQQLDPDDMELLRRTLLAQQAAGLPAGDYLEELAQRAPGAMNPGLWEQLGAARSRDGKTQAALDAYLQATGVQGHTPSPQSATAIGKLFLQLDNLPQAERWFSAAAESDDPNALSALFGLLEIHHRNKDWPKVELILGQLQEQFPGSVEASHWARLPEEIAAWRKAQDALQAKLEADKEPPASQSVETSPEETGETADTPAENSTADAPAPDAAAPSGKQAALADLEAAIAMADKPAIEQELVPAEDFEEEAVTPPPPDPAKLVKDARLAEQERDYKTAIQLYWQALGPANESAEIWNRLSLAYLVDGQIQNAETAALESLRLEPENEPYMLDYLRVIQRTRSLPDFLAELRTAYERFPRSPDIVLSLARAYERIGGNDESAANAYRRFIQLAPAHPLRPEAEAALNSLP